MNLPLGMCDLLGKAGDFDKILNSCSDAGKRMDGEGCIFKYSVGFGGEKLWVHSHTLSLRVQNSFLPSKEQETRSDLFLSFL